MELISFFFFKCQGFLQRLFIHYIYFLGHDFNKPSPEELVAINFMEGLLKKLKANGLREGLGHSPSWVFICPQTHFTESSFTGHKQEEQEEKSSIIRQDGGFQPLLKAKSCYVLIFVGRALGRQEQKPCQERDMEDSGNEFIRVVWCMGVRWLSDVPHLIRVSSHPAMERSPDTVLGNFTHSQSILPISHI